MKRSGLFAGVFCVLFTFSALGQVTTIEQLDAAALFSFSLVSDNRGDSRIAQGNLAWKLPLERMDDWITDHDKFVIGLGDHVAENGANNSFLTFMQNDSYWHNNFYPTVADHDNAAFDTVNHRQAAWGMGCKIFDRLNNFYNRPDVQFRPKEAGQIRSNDGLWYDDQLVDYYALREHSGIRVHMLTVHIGDSSPLAARSKNWMMNKLRALNNSKTDRDLIILFTQADGVLFNYVTSRGELSWSEADEIMATADMVVDASTHIFGWHTEQSKYCDGDEALWINTGAVCNTGDTYGYVTCHVFDNPPRFTMQFIDTQYQTTRKLHVGPKPHASDKRTATPERIVPYVKEINGPYYQANWANFPLNPVVNAAQFISQSVPASMIAGRTTNVTVSMKNTGTSTWSPSDAQKLGSLGDSNTWGLVRAVLTNSVAPGKTNVFTFNITAPATAGTYSFQWRMVDDAGSNIGWFGTTSTLKKITVTAGTTTTTVPGVTSLTLAAAGTSITNAGLAVGSVSSNYHSTVAAGKIFSQTPGGGTVAALGSSVALAVSLGPQPTTTTVPWVTNQTLSVAGTAITNAGLVVSSVSSNYSSTIEAGKVFSQTPGGGTVVARGSSVALAVSLGPVPATTVPFISVAAHDGYVDESSETSNAGGSMSATLTSGTAIRVGDTGARKQRKGFVSFNTASLPDNAVVTKAVLKLKRGGIVGTPASLGALTVDIKMTSFGFGTTEALEIIDFQAAASKSNVGTLSYPTANDTWATATLNADGIARINKTDHTQFRIRFTTDDDNDSSDDYLGFYPGENATAANRPVLEVTYQ